MPYSDEQIQQKRLIKIQEKSVVSALEHEYIMAALQGTLASCAVVCVTNSQALPIGNIVALAIECGRTAYSHVVSGDAIKGTTICMGCQRPLEGHEPPVLVQGNAMMDKQFREGKGS